MSKMNHVTTIETSEDIINLVMNIPKSKLKGEILQDIILNNIETLDNILNLNDALYPGDWDPKITIVINIDKNETQNTECDNIESIYLGDHVTEEQSAAIANGSFDGLPIGSYWTRGGDTRYVIMAHDQFYGYNDISIHHVVVMPDTILVLQKYNNNDINTGGYIASALKNYIEEFYNPYITSIFGDNHILAHQHDLTSGSYTSGTLTKADNTKAWLVNSYNLEGRKYVSETNYSWQTADMTQFPAFKKDSSLMISKYNGSTDYWWLGSSASGGSYYFYGVNPSGTVSYYNASSSNGVRPAFLVY